MVRLVSPAKSWAGYNPFNSVQIHKLDPGNLEKRATKSNRNGADVSLSSHAVIVLHVFFMGVCAVFIPMLGFPSWRILTLECFVNRELAKLLSRGFKNHRTGRPGRVSHRWWVSKDETQTSVGFPLHLSSCVPETHGVFSK